MKHQNELATRVLKLAVGANVCMMNSSDTPRSELHVARPFRPFGSFKRALDNNEEYLFMLLLLLKIL